MDLLDLQLGGGVFTWFIGDKNNAASRIDRILISKEWDDSFSTIKQVVLQRLCSDHNPIALQCRVWGSQ